MANGLWNTLFAQHAGREEPFLFLKDGQTISYEAYIQETGRMANALADAGVAPGDRILVQVAKTPESLALYGACMRMGAVFLPLNTAYTASEVDYFAGDAEPAVIVCDPANAVAIGPIAEKIDAAVLTLDANGAGSLKSAADKAASDFAPADRGPDDLAAILYTSGTTGRSKGAMLTQDNLLSNALALTDVWRFTADDVLLHALPIFHTHGLFVATNVTLKAGGSMIFLPAFKVDEVITHLPKATAMMGVPTFYTRLLDAEAFTGDVVKHMRLFVAGSAPLLAETHRAFEERTGHRILERYGMTETGMITSNPYEAERRAGTVGFPLPLVSVRVCDPESGGKLPQGDIGVIEVKGPNVFKGYWRMPEKTKEEFRADGFFVTGDMGRIDDEGYVVIVGRAKDLIISGGFNVYPKEVELAIDEIPGVIESAVVGAPHPDFGEGVIGVVVPENTAQLSEDAVLASLKDKLARFKQPKRIFFCDALPRNAMGKVQKNQLRDAFGAAFKERA